MGRYGILFDDDSGVSHCFVSVESFCCMLECVVAVTLSLAMTSEPARLRGSKYAWWLLAGAYECAGATAAT